MAFAIFCGSAKICTFCLVGVVHMHGPHNQTIACNYPLPNIEDILIRQGNNFIFSVLDLRKAFQQMLMDPNLV